MCVVGTEGLTQTKRTHKPRATCKAATVLISASVVLLSFLFFRVTGFLSLGLTSALVHGLRFPFATSAQESGCWGAKSGQGSWPMKCEEGGSPGHGLPRGRGDCRALVGPGIPGKLPQSHCHRSCPGSSAVTRSPTWGFFSLFLCYLHNASKDYFGNI